MKGDISYLCTVLTIFFLAEAESGKSFLIRVAAVMFGLIVAIRRDTNGND